MKLITLAIAVAMLAACGGGGPDPDQKTGASNDDGFTATTSIGAITTNNVDASGSTYQGERH